MTDIEAFGVAVERALGAKRGVVRREGEGWGDFGRRVCGLVRVRVRNYPCCNDRAWGVVGADGMVMLDDGDGFGWQHLRGQHHIEIHMGGVDD